MSPERRPVEEIHRQAEELGSWFESFDESQGSDMPVAEYLLERAARAKAQCEREITRAVNEARASGATWRRIGELLGLSEGQARDSYDLGDTGQSLSLDA